MSGHVGTTQFMTVGLFAAGNPEKPPTSGVPDPEKRLLNGLIIEQGTNRGRSGVLWVHDS